MTRTVDLWRHTDAEGDVLSADGVRAAVEIGRALKEHYDVGISSGAQRATQTLACFLAGLRHPVAGGVIVVPGLRSAVEERWFEVSRRAEGKDLEAFRKVDPDLVEKESMLHGDALGALLQSLPEAGRALVVGH